MESNATPPYSYSLFAQRLREAEQRALQRQQKSRQTFQRNSTLVKDHDKAQKTGQQRPYEGSLAELLKNERSGKNVRIQVFRPTSIEGVPVRHLEAMVIATELEQQREKERSAETGKTDKVPTERRKKQKSETAHKWHSRVENSSVDGKSSEVGEATMRESREVVRKHTGETTEEDEELQEASE